MNANTRFELENELESLDRVVKAAEDWSKLYSKDADTHTALIKNEAKMQRLIRAFFKDQAANAYSFVNWNQYSGAIQAYDINTVVNDEAVDSINGAFVNIIFDPLATATAIGTQAFESIYGLPFGLQSTNSIVQELALSQVAGLVGMRITKDGQMIPNPNAAYRISDSVRSDIRQSLHSSISLGETISEATDRLTLTLGDPSRAELIAQTETVNAYQGGLMKSGEDSGAVGKQWQDNDAVDVCAEYSAVGANDDGIVAFDYDYDGSGLQAPVAHPRCRCGMRLIYQVEADREGYDL